MIKEYRLLLLRYRLLSAELGRSHFYQFAEIAVEGAHCLEARRSGNVFNCVVRVVRKQEQVHGMTDAQAEKIILQGQSCGTPHSGGEITLVCAKSFNQVVTLEVVVEVRLFFSADRLRALQTKWLLSPDCR